MPTTRRHFLSSTVISGTGLRAMPPAMQIRVRPNDRIRIATIGIGGMGTADTHASLANPGVELVAVCDLYEGRRIRAKEVFGNQTFVTSDYREILDRKDIDAVIIGTTDHWHAPISIAAMEAGKDVYCEKPMVHSIEEGKSVVAAQQRTGRILQVGSQRVSSIVYQKARDLIKSGVIGELNLVEAWWNRNSALGAFQASIPPEASTATIDWDRYVSNTTRRPFDAARFFRWRCFRDYGTGVAGDLFVHLFSGVHFVLDSTGPERVYATGGIRFWKDGREAPDLLLGLYDYPASSRHPAFNLSLRVNFEDGAGESSGFRFIGSEGVLSIGRGVTVARHPREKEPGYSITTFPKSVQENFLTGYRQQYPASLPIADAMRPDRSEDYLPPQGYSDHLDHHRNFITAIRTRKAVVEDATFGMRAAAPALLSNVSYSEQRVCRWDAGKMVSQARVR